MSLDLAPEVETTVRRYAEREGVSLDELLQRTFPPINSPSTAPSTTDDPTASISALLGRWQQEYGLPARPDGLVHTPAHELFARWKNEDAGLTAEEAEADRRLWEDYGQQHQGTSL